MTDLFGGYTSQGPASTDQSALCGSCRPEYLWIAYIPTGCRCSREGERVGRLEKIESLTVAERQTKYKKWHDQIISRAQKRKQLGCYRERHHILPRSFGGGDQASNLVDLTFREHFLVHWLLTKICAGGERRRMQMAMLALVLPVPGRDIKPWQSVVARSVVSDLEADPEAEDAWYDRYWDRKEAGRRQRRMMADVANGMSKFKKEQRRQRRIDSPVPPAIKVKLRSRKVREREAGKLVINPPRAKKLKLKNLRPVIVAWRSVDAKVTRETEAAAKRWI